MPALERHALIVHQRTVVGEDNIPAAPIRRGQTCVADGVGGNAAPIGPKEVNMAVCVQVQKGLRLAIRQGHDFKLTIGVLQKLRAGVTLLCLGA